MPKKKGSGKLSKMTDEERILHLEQQKLAEEEMRKKKEEMLTQYLKDKLAKEEKATRLNKLKLNQQWRNIMRVTKSKELRKDLEILAQTFERVVDRKDSILKSSIKDLNESEEQYMMALRSHLVNVDNLIDTQNQRLRRLHLEFEDEMGFIKTEFLCEEEFMKNQHVNQLNNLKDIFVALDTHYTNKELEAKMDYHSLRDELKNKNLEDKHALRLVLEGKVNQLWLEFKAALQNYTETTEERKGHFENLKAKDEKSAAEIEHQMRRLQSINENIANVKSKMNIVAKEYDEKNRSLKEEREKLVSHFQDLKYEINKLRESQHEKLTKMAMDSNLASKRVAELLVKAEQIIKLAERCRRLETEEEKVLPFYMSSLTTEEEKTLKEVIETEGDPEIIKLMKRCAPLELFWRRFNKVHLEKLALDKEHSMLTQENQQLRSLLKQYLDGISVNDDVISANNSLFVVNGRTNVNLKNAHMDPRVRAAPKFGVEAMHAVTKGVPSRILDA